ncbi:MAG: hypothetical protein ACK4OK_06605 [Thermoflexus sp.]
MSQKVRLKMIDEDGNAHYFQIEEHHGEYIVYQVELGLLTDWYTEIAQAKSFDRALEYARSFVGRKIKRIEEQ